MTQKDKKYSKAKHPALKHSALCSVLQSRASTENIERKTIYRADANASASAPQLQPSFEQVPIIAIRQRTQNKRTLERRQSGFDVTTRVNYSAIMCETRRVCVCLNRCSCFPECVRRHLPRTRWSTLCVYESASHEYCRLKLMRKSNSSFGPMQLEIVKCNVKGFTAQPT